MYACVCVYMFVSVSFSLSMLHILVLQEDKLNKYIFIQNTRNVLYTYVRMYITCISTLYTHTDILIYICTYMYMRLHTLTFGT